MKISRILLFGGILAPAFYLLNDIVGGLVTPDFNYIINTVSDLTKTGSTYWLGSVFLVISSLMSIAFGTGIILKFKFRVSKLIFAGGLFLTIIGALNILTGTIFPQDPIGGAVTFPGTMHLVLVGIVAILLFPGLLTIAIGLFRLRQWKSFRLYTFITVAIMIISGGLAAVVIANGLEMLGLIERISVYTFEIWSVVLAVLLLKEQPSAETNSDEARAA